MNSIATSTNAVVVRLLSDAEKALDADRDAAKYYIAQATAILQGEYYQHQQMPGFTRGSTGSRLAQWQIDKVRLHIEQHLDTVVRTSTLARISRLSTTYFPVTFKHTFGETLHAYLTRRRVERSQELMLTTDLLLGQIALDCGFCDQGHFCRVFRRLVGNTPNQWRRQRTAMPI